MLEISHPRQHQEVVSMHCCVCWNLWGTSWPKAFAGCKGLLPSSSIPKAADSLGLKQGSWRVASLMPLGRVAATRAV